MTSTKPRVLLTNDDGPPSPRYSPYVFGLWRHLTKDLGWVVKVVLPSSQKSWIGNAHHITEVAKGRYYYPTEPDGNGETSITSRPLKYGEVAEWILLDGTPATCANVALHNIHPGQIDLVISGPNLGRNTSCLYPSALALSSGTIGAALSSSLSKTRSIAISYATVLHPTPTTFFDPAHILGGRIISHLWHNWGEDQGGLRGEADLYSVNIPLIEGLLDDQGLKICWTRMWRNSYGRLFQAVSTPESGVSKCTVNAAGPDSLSTDLTSVESSSYGPASDESGDLVFKWSPDMDSLITPSLSTLPPGSDGWAIHKGWVSVTPLRASFAEPPVQDVDDMEDKVRKVKL